MQGDSSKFVDMINEQLQYIGSLDLMLYFIKEQVYTTEIDAGVQILRAEIVFGRRLLSIIMTTTLPTIIAAQFFKKISSLRLW